MTVRDKFCTREATALHLQRLFRGDVDVEVRRRGWDGLDDLIKDVGLKPRGASHLGSKETGPTEGGKRKLTYGSVVKGYAEWKMPKPTPKSSKVTFLMQIGATADKGDHDHPLYKTWVGMLNRTLNPKSPQYAQYKCRAPSKEWLTFKTFASDMGLKPVESMSLERVDNSKGYSKENCKWATRKEQQLNKSTNLSATYEGRTWKVEELAGHLGLAYDTVRLRVASNWPEADLGKPAGYRSEERDREGVLTMCEKKGIGVTFQGRKQPIKWWLKELGIPAARYNRIVTALRHGASPDEVFSKYVKQAD